MSTERDTTSETPTATQQPTGPFVFRLVFGLLAGFAVFMYLVGTDSTRAAAFFALPINMIGMVLTWIWEELAKRRVRDE